MPIAASTSEIAAPPSRVLNVSLWVAQVLLAAVFALAGVMKTTSPIAELAQNLTWADDMPAALVRFIGASELAAAIGLILPAVTRIKPILTPLAAAGLVLVMLLASGFHLSRGEIQSLPVNIALGALAVFVVWGRIRKAPITPRS